ncbi:Uncharacterised protein [Vibrio cholerae]|nr:Uncharacterised protein [Vibrio cholerae]
MRRFLKLDITFDGGELIRKLGITAVLFQLLCHGF